MFALLRQSGDWSTLDPTVMTDALVNKRVYVLLVEGLMRQDAEAVEIELRGDGYFGALDVRPRNPVHWLLYDQSLIRKFRVVGDELRLFYDATLEEVDPGSRDEGSFEEWRQRAIFATVEWEEHGLRGTIFDQYDTLENAQRLGELEDYLSGRLGAVVNEIVLRSRDLDPVLLDALHAALAGDPDSRLRPRGRANRALGGRSRDRLSGAGRGRDRTRLAGRARALRRAARSDRLDPAASRTSP